MKLSDYKVAIREHIHTKYRNIRVEHVVYDYRASGRAIHMYLGKKLMIYYSKQFIKRDITKRQLLAYIDRAINSSPALLKALKQPKGDTPIG